MKTFIGLVMFVATSVFAFLTFAITPSFAAMAAQTDLAPIVVNEMLIKNLSHTSNRSISVFYASGSAATWATNGGVPFIRSIKAGPVVIPVNSDGSATIPQISVPHKGFEVMNYIVISVHSANQSDSNILNPNGTVPSANGPVDLTGVDQTSFDNDRVIYLPVVLNPGRASVSQIRGITVNGSQQVVIDAGSF